MAGRPIARIVVSSTASIANIGRARIIRAASMASKVGRANIASIERMARIVTITNGTIVL